MASSFFIYPDLWKYWPDVNRAGKIERAVTVTSDHPRLLIDYLGGRVLIVSSALSILALLALCFVHGIDSLSTRAIQEIS
jgi:hypothetical protein